MMWRDLYREAIDPESFFETAYLRPLVSSSAAEPTPGLAQTCAALERWRDGRAEAIRARVARAGADGTTDQLVQAVLTQSWPLATSLGCWLQGLSAPGVFEDDVQLRAMALYAQDVGVGRPQASRGHEFRLLLSRQGLTDIAVEGVSLAAVAEVEDLAFAMPATLQALSRRSDAFGFHLIGADAAFRSIGLLPWWSAARGLLPTAVDWNRLDLAQPATDESTESPQDTVAWVVRACQALGPQISGDLDTGAAWLMRTLQTWETAVDSAVDVATDPQSAMATLVQTRAREAAVYHRDFHLGGRCLSQWLREARTEPGPFLQALATSKLVRPGSAERSVLVNGLVSDRGAMFRVFSPADLATVRRWIDALPADPSPVTPAASALPALAAPKLPNRTVGASAGHTPTTVRDAYFVLQGRALAPRTRVFALDYAQQWLAAARRGLKDGDDRAVPTRWTAAGLRPWLLDQHERHDADFSSSDQELPSREAVIHSTVQLAPLTLIDGAWLQGFTDLDLASSRIGAPLFATYWDELGNGKMALNHPKIYRDVLREMGVELAATGSWEFAHDPRLLEESLRLPVYWLALGKFPLTLLPEILGMNLAMELSGVGGSYRSARRFLKHYRFSTRFVDIHNTIDNVSTGHSAWAADAIDTYMLTRVNHRDPKELEAAWLRVRTGYASLSPQPAPSRGVLTGLARRLRPGTTTTSTTETSTFDLTSPLMHHTPVRTTV